MSVRTNPWPLVAAILALALAYDLGARTQPAAPRGSVAVESAGHVSRQVDVASAEGQTVYMVPADKTFILKDLLLANTQGNQKNSLNVKENVYPSLYDSLGTLKLSGMNLMDWAKGNNSSPLGGGRKGKSGSPIRSQTGVVGLTGGVVFEPGSQVIVRDYVGPLYLDGILLD
jgi:hypothetical protein